MEEIAQQQARPWPLTVANCPKIIYKFLINRRIYLWTFSVPLILQKMFFHPTPTVLAFLKQFWLQSHPRKLGNQVVQMMSLTSVKVPVYTHSHTCPHSHTRASAGIFMGITYNQWDNLEEIDFFPVLSQLILEHEILFLLFRSFMCLVKMFHSCVQVSHIVSLAAIVSGALLIFSAAYYWVLERHSLLLLFTVRGELRTSKTDG